MLLHDLVQDVRYGWRQFARTPMLAGVAVLTLALGIGANTAIFSLLDTALFQRLAVKHPEELRTLVVITRSGSEMSNVPSEFFDQLRSSPQSFSGVFAFWRMKMNIDTDGGTDRILVQLVSGSYYSALGVTSFLGRTINEEDERSPEHVAVLSYSFWRHRFEDDPAVLGKTMYLNGVPTVIVGIAPPGFNGTDQGISPEVTIPLRSPIQFSNVWTTVRLRSGVSEKQAQVEADLALQRALESIRPNLGKYRASDRAEILTQRAGLLPGDKGLGLALNAYMSPLQVLMLLSGVLLLIGCVNIANLLLARAAARVHEIGVRLALGAGRRRLVRQLLTETALLSVIGGVAGVALAFWMQRALVLLLMDDGDLRAIPFTLNTHVLMFSAGVTILTLLLFGLVPAMRATSINVWSLLKRTARSDRAWHGGLARSLIVSQVAASMLLLSGTVLLLRSFNKLNSLDTGVPVENMLVMKIGLSQSEDERRQPSVVYPELVARAEAVPGVMSATLGADFAFGSGVWQKSVWVEGQPPEQSQNSGFNVIGPGFFSSVGIPVVLGREFTRQDSLGAPKVVMINDAFARRYFPGQSPVGRHLGDAGANSVRKFEVIGVVGNSRNMFLRETPGPMLYQPLLQDEQVSSVVLHVRARGNPKLLQERVRSQIREIDKRIPVYDVMTLSERVSLAMRRDRMMAVLASFFGSLALLLTVIGVYAVITYAVERRTTEIGVRRALGATEANVLWMVLRETLTLVVAGAALGIPLSFACTRVLKAMLYGVSPQDPTSLAWCIGVLITAGIAAGYLPARRAMRVDPMVALRYE